MTSPELIKNVIKKLDKYKFAILATGLIVGTLLYFKTKSQRPVYTAKATVFPLTASTENSASSSAISSILGVEAPTKSFSSEAAINIIELTLSRNLRKRVAGARVPQFGNKTVTELLVEDINNHQPYFQKSTLTLPADSAARVIIGAEMIKPNLEAKMGKNGLLELNFSSPNKDLVTPISNIIIEKLSQFYIDLKITKALADYNFTVKKLDSIQSIINTVDKRAINMQNSTFFTPMEKLEYTIPKENLSLEKSHIQHQKDVSINNREEAVWRLQKATPIISVLDTPTEPFTVTASSPKMYAIFGFLGGCFVCGLILIAQLILTYTKAEMRKSFGKEEEVDLAL